MKQQLKKKYSLLLLKKPRTLVLLHHFLRLCPYHCAIPILKLNMILKIYFSPITHSPETFTPLAVMDVLPGWRCNSLVLRVLFCGTSTLGEARGWNIILCVYVPAARTHFHCSHFASSTYLCRPIAILPVSRFYCFFFILILVLSIVALDDWLVTAAKVSRVTYSM